MSERQDDSDDHSYTREDLKAVALAVGMFLLYMAVMVVAHEVKVGWT